MAGLMLALIATIASCLAGGAYHVAVAAEGETVPAAVAACPNAIAACGCTITKPGIYDVTSDLTSGQGLTAKGGCIDVLAKGVLLFLNGHAITGAGTMTGVGIHLLAGANGALIEGSPTPLDNSDNTIVSGWEEGVEVESNNSLLDSIAANQNKFGALLNKARGNNVASLGTESNAVYGVWLRASSSNQIDSLFTDKNGNAGLYLGCSDSGPIGKRCKGVGTSNKNLIYSNFVGNGGLFVNPYGIAIDLGNTGNLLTSNDSHGNTTFDALDKNPGCAGNKWIGNNFDTQSSDTDCIK